MILAFVLRFLEGLGVAAFLSANYASMAAEFPERTSTILVSRSLFAAFSWLKFQSCISEYFRGIICRRDYYWTVYRYCSLRSGRIYSSFFCGRSYASHRSDSCLFSGAINSWVALWFLMDYHQLMICFISSIDRISKWKNISIFDGFSNMCFLFYSLNGLSYPWSGTGGVRIPFETIRHPRKSSWSRLFSIESCEHRIQSYFW